MNEIYSRTELLLGHVAMERLWRSRVAVFGVGGVGGYVAEALSRSGIGEIDLTDHDKVSVSNINRQIIATMSTIGRYKTDVMSDRIQDINPRIKVHIHKCFYLPENAEQFDFSEYDYVVDAIDTVTGKIELIQRAHGAGVPVISSMGAGNKLDPTGFCVSDIYDTSVCPLAKVMRKELRARGIERLKVVYSKEPPIRPEYDADVARPTVDHTDVTGGHERKRSIPGSVAFVPSAAGLIIAGEVVKDLINQL